jgi:hypothetical protein
MPYKFNPVSGTLDYYVDPPVKSVAGLVGSPTAAQLKTALNIGEADVTNLVADLSSLAAGIATAQAAATVNGTFVLSGRTKQIVYNVRDYGTINGDGVTDDQAVIQAAIDAANAAGGGFVQLPSVTHFLALPLTLKSNVVLRGMGAFATTLTTNIVNLNERSLINISGATNVGIENMRLVPNQPTSGLGVGAITSYGHTGLYIRGVEITGTTNTGQTVIQLSGGSSAATGNFIDTYIQECYIHDLPNTANGIRLYPRNGHKVYNTTIVNNRFVRINEKSVMLDCFDILENTVVDKNIFRDIKGNVTNAGSAVWTNSGNYYYIDGLKIINNDYTNTIITPGQDQGFAFFYTCKNVTIANNRMIGSWTPNQNTIGPALAPGRIFLPVIGLKVYDNFIKGFDAACDPDSMIDADIHDNTIIRCGQTWGPGYGIQENINIHDNFFYNSPHGTPANCATALGSASIIEKNVRLVNNTYLDDRPVPTPTGVGAFLEGGGSLTLATPYYYVVSATDPTGETLASTEVTATPAGANRTVRVQFPYVEGATGYKFYRSTVSGSYGASSLLATESQPLFYDNGSFALTAGTPAVVSTVQLPTTTVGLLVQGGSGGGVNHSNVLVKGNKFRLPRSTYTSLLKKELPDSVLPRRFEDNEFEDASGRVLEVVFPIGNSATTVTFDRANGQVQTTTFTGNVTATFTNGLMIGETLQVRITQDATGGRTITMPSNVKSAGTLLLSTAAGVTDIVSYVWDGTFWRETTRAMSSGSGSGGGSYVDLSTPQTIGGVKTFSSAPVVPSNSFPQAAITNLTTDLAAKQATGNYITALTGDATAAGPGSAVLTLATVATPGTAGAAATVPVVTINAKGLTTSLTSVAIQIAQSQVTNLVSDLAAKAPTASPTFTGTVTVPTPVNATDAVTKAYADGVASGVDVKASVRAATTANITLSGAQTIDGVSVIAGDRVLVKDQTAGAENGIYVAAAGAWARASDADTSAEVTSGLFTFVSQGTLNASIGYVLTTADPIVLGTTSLAFTQFSGAGTILAGTGLTKVGNTISVDTAVVATTNNTLTLTNKSMSGATNTFTAIPLTTAVTGILPIANGGTGSATQNFVDLSTTQTVGGAKTFSSVVTLGTSGLQITDNNTFTIDKPGAYGRLQTFAGAPLTLNPGGNNVIIGATSTGLSNVLFVSGKDIVQSGSFAFRQTTNALIFQTDTANDLLFKRNTVELMRIGALGLGVNTGAGVSPTSTFQVVGSFATAISAKTGAYTLTGTDDTVTGNATTATFALTLPTAVGIAGRRYVLKKTDASANAVTVATTSSQTIDGATTYSLATQYKYVIVMSDGANWIIVGNN